MGPPSGASSNSWAGASPCPWSAPHAGLEGPPLVWSPIHIFRDSLDSPASSSLWRSALRPPPVRVPPRPPCRVGSHTPASGAGSGCFSRLAGVCEVRPPVRLPPRPQCGVPHCSRGHCGGARLGLFVGRKKSRQVPDSNPRPPDPQPSSLTTRTQELDAFHVCIFIPWSARGASSSRGLEDGGGRRLPRGLRIRLSPNGGSRHWRWSHWGVLLAVCWLLHLGLVALPGPSTWGCAQCRFLLGWGGLHALGWRGLHDAGSPTAVVCPSPVGMEVPPPHGSEMGLCVGPAASSRSRGPSSRNGPT